jgi:hypothetical protein
MALVGALILVVAVVGFILQPVLRGQFASLEQQDDEMTEAEARRRVSLLALRDAEYDYETGKLDREDYLAMKRQLSAEALAALAALEEGESPPPAGEAQLEAEIAAARSLLEGGVRCATCAHRNPLGSRFCGACGSPLASSEAAARAQ